MSFASNFWILISIGLTFYIILDESLFDRFSEPQIQSYLIDVFETCNLTIYDPYYKDMGLTVSWDNPMAGCNRSYTPVTVLRNGTLFIDPKRKEGLYCRARTYEYIHATKSRPKEWFNLTGEVPIKSDLVQTECYSEDKTLVDQYLHQQIYEGNPSTVRLSPSNVSSIRPDVVMIVLDSVSSTQARRSIPRTLSFLETKLAGIHFHHLNKVGENTRPNAYAMLLGWRIYTADRRAVNAKSLSPDHSNVCGQYRDNDPVLFREYEKIGYKTLMSDDYQQGTAFSWACKGFQKQQANHVFRPFLYAYHNEKKLREYMGPKNCFEIQVGQLQQSENFLNAYKGVPKFLLHWAGEASHDDSNRLYHTDQDYVKFFEKNLKKLENAFVFVMGDHGPRFGKVAKTELNKREINNPLLHISLPKFLRNNNQLLTNFKENSQRLLTQFDIYATLLDILKFAPESNFTDFTERDIMEGNENNGTSLLRPFPEKFQKRSCKNIPVNSIYCLCEYQKEKIGDPGLIKKAAKLAMDELNGFLLSNNATELCATLILDQVKSLNAYSPATLTNLYEIFFNVKPSGGEFSVLLKNDQNGVLKREGDFLRLNKYGKQSECIDSKLASVRSICFCKNQQKS